MVMYEIIKADRLNALRNNMDLIHKDCFDQFVGGVLSWYQHEVAYPTLDFDENRVVDYKPPNLFNLFEYPNVYGEATIGLFIDSETNYLMEVRKKGYADARDGAIEIFNQANAEYRDYMMSDAGKILDEYHLFYCYHDDTFSETHYYNPYVKEVW